MKCVPLSQNVFSTCLWTRPPHIKPNNQRSQFVEQLFGIFYNSFEVWSKFGKSDPRWDLVLFKGHSPTGMILTCAATDHVSMTPSPCASKGCIISWQLPSALTEIRAALPSQGRLWLEGIPKVRRRHQKSWWLGQVDCMGSLEAARCVRWRWRCHKAPRLCPGKGEPANRATGRTGTCRSTGLPRRRPEACRGQDHGKSLSLIAPQRKSYWLRWLFRS